MKYVIIIDDEIKDLLVLALKGTAPLADYEDEHRMRAIAAALEVSNHTQPNDLTQ